MPWATPSLPRHKISATNDDDDLRPQGVDISDAFGNLGGAGGIHAAAIRPRQRLPAEFQHDASIGEFVRLPVGSGH